MYGLDAARDFRDLPGKTHDARARTGATTLARRKRRLRRASSTANLAKSCGSWSDGPGPGPAMSIRNALTICECISSLACTAAHASRNRIARGGCDPGSAQCAFDVFLPPAPGRAIAFLFSCEIFTSGSLSYIRSENHVRQHPVSLSTLLK